MESLHPYQRPECWANHSNESLRYLANKVNVKWTKEKFVFTIDPDKKGQGFFVQLSKILFNDEDELTPVVGDYLAYGKNINDAKRFISRFKCWDEERQINFLSKKNIQIYIPEYKNTVIATFGIGNNKIKNEVINKQDLARSGESIDEFDGIDRLKDMFEGVDFQADSRLITKSKRSSKRINPNQLKRNHVKNKKVMIQDVMYFKPKKY